MAFAIAVYDERPDIYKNVAGRYFSEMVDSKKFLAESHSSLFGNSYSTVGEYSWKEGKNSFKEFVVFYRNIKNLCISYRTKLGKYAIFYNLNCNSLRIAMIQVKVYYP